MCMLILNGLLLLTIGKRNCHKNTTSVLKVVPITMVICNLIAYQFLQFWSPFPSCLIILPVFCCLRRKWILIYLHSFLATALFENIFSIKNQGIGLNLIYIIVYILV